MRILVAYYSRTGTTQAVGETLAVSLSATSDEIVDEKIRLGMVGYMRAARDAKGLKTTDIKVKKDPEEYDLVLVGTPIWWGNLTPAVRTYLMKHNLAGKKVAFFITSQDVDRENVFAQMTELTPSSEHIATLGLLQKDVKHGDLAELVGDFLEQIRVATLKEAAPIP
jgi:menaquinone-dependent protoporphyrinogen IX oxidase